MNVQASRKSLVAAAHVFRIANIVLCVTHLVDFAFIGRHPTDLIAAVGFALMAYGGLDHRSASTVDKKAQFATGIGLALALGAVLTQFLL